MRARVQRLDGWLACLERRALVLGLTTVLALGLWQVLARNLFATGLVWADELVQHLVLWLGFLGASLATREQRHLRIELLTHLRPAWQSWVTVGINSAAGLVCLLLTHAAWRFVHLESTLGTQLLCGLPTWLAQSIIPLGFASMALRFLLHGLDAALAPAHEQTPP